MAFSRRGFSNIIGIPDTETTLHPHSFAHPMTTGIMPVPVPPPRTEKTMATRFPANISLMRSMFSTAMVLARN